MMKSNPKLVFSMVLLSICSTAICFAQHEIVDIQGALAEAGSGNLEPTSIQTENWWDLYATEPLGTGDAPVPMDIDELLFLTLKNSAQVKVYSEVPLIRETSINEALAAFDWTKFAESLWNDLSDPIGNSLTVGGGGTRFRDEQFTASAGLRKRTYSGGEFEISQQIGWQDTNSQFFIPDNQGTARLSLGFTQPLLRGRGSIYNTSLIVLAKIDTATAKEEFKRQLQSHLMEVVRGYWALYLERASLAQKVKLYSKTRDIFGQLQARQNIDASRSQLVSTEAALETRRSELIRARAAVENAETRLRALVNADEVASDTEFVPKQPPSYDFVDTDTYSEVETAVQNRPEIIAAMKEIKAGCVRLRMAQHEMLPQLNLITRTYIAGLQGGSDIGQAWIDQFSLGEPGYTVGLQYEVPIGLRAATARRTRRRIEARQLQEQYRTALENVKAEVEIAVRELQTSWREMFAKYRAMQSARADTETIEARWNRNADGGTGSLNLESLLRAQERLTEAEFQYLNAQLTYNLSLMNLKRANGTLLMAEQIEINRMCDGCTPAYELDMTDYFDEDFSNEIFESVVADDFGGEAETAKPANIESEYFEP